MINIIRPSQDVDRLLRAKDVNRARLIIQAPRRMGEAIINIVEAILTMAAIIKEVNIYRARGLS